MNLRELQRRMFEDVVRSSGSAGAAYIKANDRLTSSARLDIYHRQYWSRLMDALREDFPGLLAVLGSRPFTRLTRAYLGDQASRSWTLRDLGQGLETWLAAHPEYAGARLSPALDMVRLEWAHIESFDSAEATPLTPEDLAAINPRLTLGLQPHLRLLHLQCPVDDIRLRAPKRPAVARPAEVFLAVHRVDGGVYYRRLEPGEFSILTRLAAGGSLAAALNDAGPVQDVQRWFATWAQLGWLCPAVKRRRSSARSRGPQKTAPSSP